MFEDVRGIPFCPTAFVKGEGAPVTCQTVALRIAFTKRETLLGSKQRRLGRGPGMVLRCAAPAALTSPLVHGWHTPIGAPPQPHLAILIGNSSDAEVCSDT